MGMGMVWYAPVSESRGIEHLFIDGRMVGRTGGMGWMRYVQ